MKLCPNCQLEYRGSIPNYCMECGARIGGVEQRWIEGSEKFAQDTKEVESMHKLNKRIMERIIENGYRLLLKPILLSLKAMKAKIQTLRAKAVPKYLFKGEMKCRYIRLIPKP